MTMDVNELKARMADMEQLLVQLDIALGDCGFLDKPPTVQVAKSALGLVATTVAENELFAVYAADFVEDERIKIQACIKALRRAGCKEKETLPSGLFKWALARLTKK